MDITPSNLKLLIIFLRLTNEIKFLMNYMDSIYELCKFDKNNFYS